MVPLLYTAHTTQFTEIGWSYLKHGHGVGTLPKGGTYVGLVNPRRDHLTIVMESMVNMIVLSVEGLGKLSSSNEATQQ